MQRLMLVLALCLMTAGCVTIYDSRGENALDLSNPKYQGISADKAKFRTGRYIEVRVMMPEPGNYAEKISE